MNSQPECVIVETKQAAWVGRNYLQKFFAYLAQVDNTNSRKYYLETSEDEFKTRYNNRTKALQNKGHEKKNELSKDVWELNDKGEDFTIKWSVAAKASPCICDCKRCDLCLTEELLIA